MAYNLTRTNGTALLTLNDSTADTSTLSINLIGKNYPGYGLLINQNFIKMLENFANATAPISPMVGQLWWDTANNLLKVYLATGWKTISFSQTSTTQPLNPQIGDMWWDSNNSLLKVYSGISAGWISIGPASSLAIPATSFVANTLQDNSSAFHTVGNLIVNNKLAAIISSDTTAFTLAGGKTIGGLAEIKPGINFTSVAETGMISSTNFRLGVYSSNVEMISSGVGNGIKLSVYTALNTSVTGLFIDGTTGLASVKGSPTAALGISTKGYTDATVLTANTAMKSYVDDANTRQTTYTDNRIISANTAMKSYVDDKLTLAGAGITTLTMNAASTGLTFNGITSATINSPAGGTFAVAGTLSAQNGGTGLNNYNAGDILFSASSSPTSLSKLSIATFGSILTSTGSAPQWSNPTSMIIGKTYNLYGGATGSLPYQSASDTTTFLGIGTTGQVLTVSAGGLPVWASSAVATSLTLSNDIATNSTMYPLFWNASTGTTNTVKTSNAKLTYNPNSGVLTAVIFAGSGASLTSLPAGQLTGTLPSAVLGGSSMFIGTTSVALNRSSGGLTLTGVSIDGVASSATTSITSTNVGGGAANRILYQTAPNTTGFLATGSAGQVLVSSGASSAPAWGTVSAAAGGTGNTQVGPAGTVAYSTGSAYKFTDGAGTLGQVLTSQGAGQAPIWVTKPEGTVTAVSATVPSFLAVAVNNSTTTPQINITYSGSVALPESQGGTGVTSLSTVAVTLSGTQTISGAKTFSSTVALGSSATAATKTIGDNTTSVATTAFVQTAVASSTFQNMIVKTTSGTWTKPAGVTTFKVTVVAAGCGGGSLPTLGLSKRGGAGGCVVRYYTTTSASATYNLTVGQGQSYPNTGGSSTFVGPGGTATATGGTPTDGGGGSGIGTNTGILIYGADGMTMTSATLSGTTPSYLGSHGAGTSTSTGNNGVVVIEY